MTFFVKVKTFNREEKCYTFGNTGTGLSSWLIENTGFEVVLIMMNKFTMNLPWKVNYSVLTYAYIYLSYRYTL